jgi:LuxR family transcriptional regulator, regulator of acetate metabolism
MGAGADADVGVGAVADGSACYAGRRRHVRERLATLAALGTTAEVRRRAPAELSEACGFSRAMISAVRGSRWVPLHLHTHEELDPNAARFRAYVEGGADIPLANLLAETTMVRRRVGVLVPEALIPTRAFAPIIAVAESPAYVAAPMVVGGRTIGFVHADRVGQGSVVDDDDRRLIEAFAAELGVLYERLWWRERLADRGRRAHADLDRATRALQEIDSAAVDLRVTSDSPRTLRRASEPRRAAEHPESALTVREWDVLAHVADGATNRVIAHRLTLSEDTVKTHLKSILRKLGVAGRASAVAWYSELTRAVR